MAKGEGTAIIQPARPSSDDIASSVISLLEGKVLHRAKAS